MEEELFYNNIQWALETLPRNINILEEQIDIDTQMKYFEFSKEVRSKNLGKEYFENRDELFNEDIPDERKKEIISAIAGIDDVKAYRTLEKFAQTENTNLKDWSILAYQESRMLIQSSLLEEQQVFISTGLGGKGKSLRYFAVFINRRKTEVLNKTQRKLLKDEVIYALEKENGNFELIDFIEGFSTISVLLPLHANIKQIFRNVIDECNEYGNFLEEDMIVTNVKTLSRMEIMEMLEGNIENDDNELDRE